MKKSLSFLALSISLLLSAQNGVGINTINPTAKLDINGNLRVRNLPAGSATDSILVVNNGYVKKIAISSLSINTHKCPNFLKSQSSQYVIFFSSSSSIPNPSDPLVISGKNFASGYSYIQNNTYYYSWTNVSGQPLNINNFMVNFGGVLLCNYN